MKIDLEQIKTLAEAGDESALQAHILASLEKGDISAAVEANKDVLSELDSIKDTHHQTALGTFKKKELPKLIDAAKDEVRKELNPEETPEQKKIRELEERLNKEQQQRTRAELRSKVIELATSETVGLDAVFVAKHIDKFIPSTFEAGEDGEFDTTNVLADIQTELTGLAGDLKAVVSAQVEETMKGAARHDLGGGVGGAQQKEVSLGEKLAKQSQHAQAKEQQSQFFGQ